MLYRVRAEFTFEGNVDVVDEKDAIKKTRQQVNGESAEVFMWKGVEGWVRKW